MRRIFGILPLVFLLQSLPVVAEESTTLDPLEQVIAAGWMNRDREGDFQAQRILNRAELASILVKTFDLEK